jgi:conjugative transfer signal peptidase TraF
MRRHRTLAALAALMTGGMASLLTAAHPLLRFNLTDSMPHGLYLAAPALRPPRRGDLVALCLPEPFAQLARARRYIGGGDCPDRAAVLIKPVGAVAGDAVVVSAAGIAVNGARPEYRPLAQDSAGRPLVPHPAGLYRVAPGEIWVLSDHTKLSFDSRYIGPVPTDHVIGLMRPLTTEH